MNSETISEIIVARDAVLVAALKYNKAVMKSQIDYGVRGDYAVITLRRGSLVSPNSTDCIQAEVADILGRQCYQDPDYVVGVVATYRIKITN